MKRAPVLFVRKCDCAALGTKQIWTTSSHVSEDCLKEREIKRAREREKEIIYYLAENKQKI